MSLDRYEEFEKKDMESAIYDKTVQSIKDEGKQLKADFMNYFDNFNRDYSDFSYLSPAMNDLVRWTIKNDTVRALAEKSGISYEIVNEIVAQWARSSNNEDPNSLAFQIASAEVTGVELSPWQRHKANLASADYGVNSDMLEVASAMYDLTQERLASMGYKPRDTITLYRGMIFENYVGIPIHTIVDYQGNAIESWTVNIKVAEDFGTTVFAMDVPVENIFSTPNTGLGAIAEGEFVILGSIPGQTAIVIENYEN
jgi:hypothetical protein